MLNFRAFHSIPTTMSVPKKMRTACPNIKVPSSPWRARREASEDVAVTVQRDVEAFELSQDQEEIIG